MDVQFRKAGLRITNVWSLLVISGVVWLVYQHQYDALLFGDALQTLTIILINVYVWDMTRAVMFSLNSVRKHEQQERYLLEKMTDLDAKRRAVYCVFRGPDKAHLVSIHESIFAAKLRANIEEKIAVERKQDTRYAVYSMAIELQGDL